MALGNRTIAPMKAGAGELPVGDNWVYELKWDGMRIVSFIEDGAVRLQSTNLLDVTVSYPELDTLPDALPQFDSIVLDGEVVALGEDGLPSFPLLQRRMHIKDPTEAARRSSANPVVYVIFDVLHINGQDTFDLPFEQRRKLLEQIVENGPHWRLTDVHEDGAAELLSAVTERGMEGLMAKQRTSRYIPGKRAPVWRKIKPRGRQEMVVGGWTTGDPTGSRRNQVGGFDIGYWDETGLRYAGRVGSGLSDADLRYWKGLLADVAATESPFVDPVPKAKDGRTRSWVRPELVVEVAFSEWSPDGNLRHPSYLGQRVDVDPKSVRREP